MTKLLNVEEAAELLGTSVRFIRRIIAERRIEFVKVGRHVRFEVEALEAFIDEGRVPVGGNVPGTFAGRALGR